MYQLIIKSEYEYEWSGFMPREMPPYVVSKDTSVEWQESAAFLRQATLTGSSLGLSRWIAATARK